MDARKQRIMSAVFDQTAVGICLTDESRKFVEVNQAYCKIYGYSREELIGQPFTIVVPDEMASHAEYLHDIFMQGKPEMPIEWEVQRKDGKRIHVVITAAMMTESDGKKFKITTVTDISHQKRNAQLVNRFGRIFGKSNDEIYVFEEHEYRFIQVNDAALKNLGYTIDELKQMSPVDINPDLNFSQIKQSLEQFKNDPKAHMVLQTRQRRKDGSIYPVEVSTEYIADETPPVFVSIVQEISEKQKLLQIRQDLKTAARIQTHLMPSTKLDVPGYCISGLNIPSKEVGGDYFDILNMENGELVFCLGDVAGKGMPAALLMSNLQAVIRGQSMLNRTADGCLTMTNQLLSFSMPQDRFITLFYGILTPDTGEISSANAGHIPPIIISGDNRVSRFPKGNMALGLRKKTVYAPHKQILKKNDICIIFSDGIIESTSKDGAEYDERMLIEGVIKYKQKRSEEIAEAILADIRKFTSGIPQQDDLTLLVIKKLT